MFKYVLSILADTVSFNKWFLPDNHKNVRYTWQFVFDLQWYTLMYWINSKELTYWYNSKGMAVILVLRRCKLRDLFPFPSTCKISDAAQFTQVTSENWFKNHVWLVCCLQFIRVRFSWVLKLIIRLFSHKGVYLSSDLCQFC